MTTAHRVVTWVLGSAALFGCGISGDHAMTKLGARDRAQLVVLAYQAGLPGAWWPREA